jgi:hypothetical protein
MRNGAIAVSSGRCPWRSGLPAMADIFAAFRKQTGFTASVRARRRHSTTTTGAIGTFNAGTSYVGSADNGATSSPPFGLSIPA